MQHLGDALSLHILVNNVFIPLKYFYKLIAYKIDFFSVYYYNVNKNESVLCLASRIN